MVAAAAVTLLLIFLPGAIINYLSGMRWLPALAAAGPVFLGIAGLAGWLAHELGIPYGPLPVFVLWLIACAVALGFRLALPKVANADRRLKFTELRSYSPIAWDSSVLTALIVVAATVVGVVRLGRPLLEVTDDGHAVREHWDMQFHTNFLQFVKDTRDVSPVVPGEMLNQETHALSYYPTGWHAVAALLPGDVFQQANVFAFLAPMLIFPAGMALLARSVAGPKLAAVAGVSAAVLSLALPEIWIALLSTSSMPYLLAVTASAATMALLLRGNLFPSVWALVGLVLTHPASAVTVAIFALLWFITQPTVDLFLRLAAIGLVSGGIVFPVLQAATTQGEAIAGFTGQAKISRSQSLWNTATGMSTHTEHAVFSVAFLVVVVIGLVILLFRRKNWTPWPALALLILAAVSDSAQVRWSEPWGTWLKAIGTVYYDMPYRIQAPMGILRIVCSSIAIAAAFAVVFALAQRIKGKQAGSAHNDNAPTEVKPMVSQSVTLPSEQSRLDASALGVDKQMVSLPSSNPQTLAAPPTDSRVVGAHPVGIEAKRAQQNWGYKPIGWVQTIAIGTIAALAIAPSTWINMNEFDRVTRAGFDTPKYMDQHKKQALDWLALQPHAKDGIIINNKSEGTGWMYAYNRLPALFRHFSFDDKSAKGSLKLIDNVDLLGADRQDANEYDRIAEKLKAKYLVTSAPAVGNIGTTQLAQRSWAWWSPGLTPIYADGPTYIFAITNQFEKSELKSLLAASPHKPEQPNPLYQPPRQPIMLPGATEDPLRGATIALNFNNEDYQQINAAVSEKQQLTEVTGALDDVRKKAETLLQQHGAEVVADKAQRAEARVAVGFTDNAQPTRGFTATALTNSKTGHNTPGSWQLAAGLRDSLVFHGMSADSGYPENCEGLFPAVDKQLSQTFLRTPTVALSLGSSTSQKLLKDLKDPVVQKDFAEAIVQGIASMLFQRENAPLTATDAVNEYEVGSRSASSLGGIESNSTEINTALEGFADATANFNYS